MLSLVITAIPSLTANECVGSYLALDPPFNLRSFELYGNWFDDSSSMTLAQAGNYKGVDGIKEGFQFIFPSSPYIATVGRLRSDSSFVSFDAEKRSCVVMNKFHGRIQMSEMVGNELFETAFMITLDWRFDDQKIGVTNVFWDSSFLGYLFSALLSTPAVDNFVCQTMRDSCSDVWAANDLTSLGECEAKLAALPLAEGDELYFDGNTKSCRKLHAVFAAQNSNHCAHLSFKPMADPKGKFKCQESAQVPISALFSDDELATFATFVAEVGLEPDQHWRLSPCQTQADCPAAGDVEESAAYITGGHYTNNATCVFGTPTKRHLLFGSTPVTPKAGVCVP